MRIVDQLRKHRAVGNSAITIGVFDGVHLGHHNLLSLLKTRAAHHGLTAIAITFVEHPRGVLHPGSTPPLLTSTDERITLLAETGIDLVIPISFDNALSKLTAREFAGLLIEHVRMNRLVVGPDFAMGHRRGGDRTTLVDLSQEMGFFMDVIEPLQAGDGLVISSSAIRDAILEGDVVRAANMLGRKYSLTGTIIRGHGRGIDLGFATANLSVPGGAIVPRDGIYATWADVQGENYMAATSIGFNPTFPERDHSIEAHLLDFKGNLYGNQMRLNFVRRLRSELKFSNMDGLQQQINQDLLKTRAILEANRVVNS